MCVLDAFSLEPGNNVMFSDYAALFNIVSSFDNPDHVEFSEDYFKSSFSQPRVDIANDIVLVRNFDGKLVASGTIFDQNTTPAKSRIMVQVHPDYRCQGIGTKILHYLTQNSIERGINLSLCRIPSYRPYAISFVKNRGFENDHVWVKMHLEHKIPEKPSIIDWGFRVRGLDVTKELPLWIQLQNEIFEDDPHYEPVDVESLKALINHSSFDPNLILVGLFNEKPVGLCSGWPINSELNGRSQKKVQIQGMGVVKKYRRKGYGQTLLSELLNRAFLKGHTSSELVVQSSNDAACSMYVKYGFKEKYRYLWFKKAH